MSRTRSPSTGKPYGLARVAVAWGVPRSTYHGSGSDRIIQSSRASAARECRSPMRN